jgi:tetratricopeptide (TPR) repeat protein
MPAPNELRLFISSTFRDLQEEREHLVKKIFPEIRALCRTRGITFTEVDLRWGLTEEDQVLGQIIRTCMEEIDRCRPYFIGITGERYGYVPELMEYHKDPELLAKYPWMESAALEEASIVDLEFRHAMLNDPEASASAAMFVRRTRESLDAAEQLGSESTRLEELKERVRSAGIAIEEFRNPASLGEQVYDHLVRIIRRDFVGAAPPTPLEEERSRHRAFAESRRHAYIPNPTYLKRLGEWMATGEQPLVVYAESGSGKSSLVSYWCDMLRRQRPDLPVVEHYVGIGAGSSDHLAIMRHVIEEIRLRFDRAEEVPSKPEELEREFPNWLGFTVGQPLVIVIDGINQLSGRALDLHWIPPSMPAGVKLVITSTVEQTLVDLGRRGWERLGMQPLSEKEREAVVVRFLAEYHKALSAGQVRTLASDVKCAHPLFLRTLLEELRLDSTHEQLDRRIDRYLSTTGTEDLFQQVLERMEDDFGARAVREVMSMIWCSRAGLTEEELQELTGISRLKLSTLLGGLDYHLVRNDGALTFFHDYLRRGVEKRYMPDVRLRREAWEGLARYFEGAPVTLHATIELVQALERLGDTDRLLGTIADVERFDLLYEGEARYEVLRHWAGADRATTAELVLASLSRWRIDAGAERVLPMLTRISDLLRSLGCVAEALALDRQRLSIAEQLGDLPQQAVALASASDRLRVLGDSELAETEARRAEAIARDLGDRPTIALAVGNRGLVHYTRGEYDEALACYAEQESIARSLGDRRGVATAVGSRGTILNARGEHDAALDCFSEQESIAKEQGNRHGVAIATGNRGLVHFKRAEYDEALACHAGVEAIARELGDRQYIAQALGSRASVHEKRGEYDQVLACISEQEAIARELGDRRGIARARSNRGRLHHSRGEYDAAMACYAEQRAIALELGDRSCISDAAANRAAVHADRGEYDQTLACLAEEEVIARELGNRHSLTVLVGNRGAVHGMRGELRQALACFVEQESIARELGDRQSIAFAVGNRGTIHADCGAYDAAMACYAEQELIARELGDPASTAFTIGNRGEIHLGRGEYDKALACFVEQETIERELGNAHGLAQAEGNRGLLHAALEEHHDAVASLRSASDTFRRIGAGRDLARYAVALATSLLHCAHPEQARAAAEEGRALALEIGSRPVERTAALVLARIDAAAGNIDAAREECERLLTTAVDDGELAEPHYWLWKLEIDAAIDHRAEAERHFAELYRRIPRHEYRLKLEELRGSRPGTPK